jgi:hypothetical protein
MNYLLSESQMRLIVENSVREKLSESMKQLNEMAQDILDDVLENNKLNFKFLLTWGASIGGMMGPLRDWIAGNIPDLSPQDVSLLTLGAVAQYYYDNQRKINSLYKRIKEKGLVRKFKMAQLKADQLRDSFLRFVQSVGLTTSNLINTMSYAFLIPILEDLFHLIIGANNTQALILLIGKRLTASGVVLITGVSLNNVIKKLVKKFQEKS